MRKTITIQGKHLNERNEIGLKKKVKKKRKKKKKKKKVDTYKVKKRNSL